MLTILKETDMYTNIYSSLRLPTTVELEKKEKKKKPIKYEQILSQLASKFSGYYWMVEKNSVLTVYLFSFRE